ncbi:hypothetical protein PMIN06_000660 [Paraphaeosphaeria minitans]
MAKPRRMCWQRQSACPWLDSMSPRIRFKIMLCILPSQSFPTRFWRRYLITFQYKSSYSPESQRICQRFRHMVAPSKPVRHPLFLETTHHNEKLGDWRLLRFNPFLANQLAESFHTRAIGVHRDK